MVTGSVFCDQCKDGQVSIFDYPLSGMKVTMVCPGSGGQMTTVGDETTDLLGNYVMTYDGNPDLSSCYTEISGNTNEGGSNGCGASSGPPKSVKLMFSMFDMATYTVEPLISQPDKPMSFCPKSPSSPPTPSTSPTTPIPPVQLPPPLISNPPPAAPLSPPTTPAAPLPPPTTPKSPTPTFTLPPLPKLPPFPHLPPLPFTQASACPYQYWAMREYKCYWRAVSPDSKVGFIFGPLAAKKYGMDLTLWNGLQGKGDPYRTLLREAITSLLNSYNSFHFSYNAFEVFHHFNTALTGSTRSVLLTALRFKRANSGHGTVPCTFTACK